MKRVAFDSHCLALIYGGLFLASIYYREARSSETFHAAMGRLIGYVHPNFPEA